LVDPLILYVAGWADKREAEEEKSLALQEAPGWWKSDRKKSISPREKGQVELNHLCNLRIEWVGR
jgi:hypothetical protein